MAGRLRGQATAMSFIDIFLLLSLLFAVLAGAALLMRKPQTAGVGTGH